MPEPDPFEASQARLQAVGQVATVMLTIMCLSFVIGGSYFAFHALESLRAGGDPDIYVMKLVMSLAFVVWGIFHFARMLIPKRVELKSEWEEIEPGVDPTLFD